MHIDATMINGYSAREQEIVFSIADSVNSTFGPDEGNAALDFGLQLEPAYTHSRRLFKNRGEAIDALRQCVSFVTTPKASYDECRSALERALIKETGESKLTAERVMQRAYELLPS